MNLSLNPAAKVLIFVNRQKIPNFLQNQRPGFLPPIPVQSISSVHSALPALHCRRFILRCSAGEAAAESEESNTQFNQDQSSSSNGFWTKWKISAAEMRSKVAKLGLAAVLAYGMFDGVTYTTFFVLAFLGYEKSTGKNPAANLQALLGIVLLMWTGNNVTRPFRVAGAAALAPAIDKGLKKIQKYMNLRSQILAFALVVSMVAGSCFTVVGLLILSRWGR